MPFGTKTKNGFSLPHSTTLYAERLDRERIEELRKFAQDFKTSILEKKKQRKEIVTEKITEKVVVLACEHILISLLEVKLMFYCWVS